MLNTCPYCGSPNPSSSKYCEKCGSKISYYWARFFFEKILEKCGFKKYQKQSYYSKYTPYDKDFLSIMYTLIKNSWIGWTLLCGLSGFILFGIIGFLINDRFFGGIGAFIFLIFGGALSYTIHNFINKNKRDDY